MAENRMTHEVLEARMTLAPYHKWLGLSLLAMDDDGIEVGATRFAPSALRLTKPRVFLRKRRGRACLREA